MDIFAYLIMISYLCLVIKHGQLLTLRYMANHDIFISYSRQDRETVDMICKHLEANNITYFRDIFDIAISNVFPQTLADGILSSKLVLFIASQNSFASNYTSKEVTFAYQNHITILPLKVDDCAMPTRYSFMFSDVQCLSLTNTSIQRLIEDIKRVLAEHVDTEQPVQPQSIQPTQPKKRAAKEGVSTVKVVALTLAAVIIVAALGAGAYYFLADNTTKSEIAYNSSDEYYHITGSRKLTYDDIRGLSSRELRIMRNEIYARHGYIFQDAMLRDHFMQKPWYTPQTKNVALSSIEQYNVLFIKSYEQQ